MLGGSVRFYLVRDGKVGSLKADLEEILSFLGTYEGVVSLIKEGKGRITIAYQDTPLTATLMTNSDPDSQETIQSGQMTLTCDRRDNVSINLIKNIAGTIGYRIFNPQTQSFMANEPNLQDLTTVKLENKLTKIFRKYGLIPLFNYRNSLVYFAKDAKGNIYLVNRHLLEYLLENKTPVSKQKFFAAKVADNIGEFIALFDRGLTPLSFYEKLHSSGTTNINLSGFNSRKLQAKVFVDMAFFKHSPERQTFNQIEPSLKLELKKDQSLDRAINTALNRMGYNERPLAVKIARGVGYKTGQGGILLPLLSASVFMR